MNNHKVGHVKHNAATGDVAVRSIFHWELFPDMYWLVATPGSGGKYAPADACASWVDLYTPPEEA